MVKETMAKRRFGSLMRKKLSDITNSHQQGQSKPPTQEEEQKPLETSSIDKDLCIQQLLKERMTLMKLLAERTKMLEWARAEMQMLQGNVQKLQLQNWNLAQSNSHMLGELNLGKERIKALQHEILWRAALLKRENTRVLDDDGDERAEKPSPKASNHKQSSVNRRRCIRRRSTSSSAKNAQKEKAEDKRSEAFEGEPLENLFEIEDANYLVIQPNKLKSRTCSRNEVRALLRKSVDKAQSAKTRSTTIN